MTGTSAGSNRVITGGVGRGPGVRDVQSLPFALVMRRRLIMHLVWMLNLLFTERGNSVIAAKKSCQRGAEHRTS